jgi:hypothetical protein
METEIATLIKTRLTRLKGLGNGNVFITLDAHDVVQRPFPKVLVWCGGARIDAGQETASDIVYYLHTTVVHERPYDVSNTSEVVVKQILDLEHRVWLALAGKVVGDITTPFMFMGKRHEAARGKEAQVMTRRTLTWTYLIMEHPDMRDEIEELFDPEEGEES